VVSLKQVTSSPSRKQEKEVSQLPAPPAWMQKLMNSITKAQKQERYIVAVFASLLLIFLCLSMSFIQYFGRAIIAAIIIFSIVCYFINSFGK
jgi:hypothetical protein